MVVYRSGSIDLMNSVLFESNFANGASSVGIVNQGGQVQCDSNGCLEACTLCRPSVGDDDSLAPTIPQHDAVKDAPWSVAVVAIGLAIVCIFIAAAVGIVLKQKRSSRDTEQRRVVEMSEPMLTHAETGHGGDGSVASMRANAQAAMAGAGSESDIRTLLRSSPAPIFVIDRDMRIISWSPGEGFTVFSLHVLSPHLPPDSLIRHVNSSSYAH